MGKAPSRTRSRAIDQTFNTAIQLHEQGEIQRAEMLYRDVLRQAPRHAQALNMLGVLGCQTGNIEAGRRLIQQAIGLEPQQADFHNNAGMAALQMRALEPAIEAFEQAVRLRPRFAEAQFNLGNAHLAGGDPAAAETCFRKALRVRRDYPDALNNLGNLLRQRGAIREAVQVLRRLVSVAKRSAEAHFNLALALEAAGESDEALATYRQVLVLDAGAWKAHAHIAACHRMRGELDEARAAYDAALDIAGDEAALLNARGLIAHARNDIDAARADFERALAAKPGNARALDNLGMTWAAEGNRDRARECFERAVDAQPDLGSAWRNLSELCDDPAEAGALAARVETVASGAENDARRPAELDFALGNLRDRTGEHDAAFEAFKRGNAARKARSAFDAEQQNRYIDALIEVFDKAWFEAAAEYERPADETPVLVLGMPRSGTSLVEQILASHPSVAGAGELTFFPERIARLSSTLASPEPFPFCVRDRGASLVPIAGQYLQLLREAGGAAVRVTDKMPYNFLYLGLIAAILPGTRVVHCRRDPIATCFSIYTRDLVGNHPYAYDFDDLACAYAGYERLMAHWRSVLPLGLFEIDYETLLAATEPTARELVAFCGLPWSASCLAFHTTARPVTTASQWQVRKPLYHTAKGHWQHYAQHLVPLTEALERHGVASGGSGPHD